MTKKQAGVIALIAFVALIRPCSNMFTFADLLWSVVFKTGMMNTPYMRLCVFMFDRFGRGAAELTSVAIIWTIAVFVTMVIYRYLRRRDFAQVCADCAAHKVWAWLAFAAFLLFSFTSLSRAFYPVGCDQAELPLDEVMEHNPTATLELRLCHPESDRLERELKANGRLTDEVLAAAPQIEGYSLMRVRGKDDAVCYVCDDVELSMKDFASAKAYESLFNKGVYEISAKLTPEGRGRLARLTRDYQPQGAKNTSNHGRALAIVVNGELVTAPIIQTEIDMGEFVITGKFTKEEAVALAAALNYRGGEED
jgi:hypothetical protein